MTTAARCFDARKIRDAGIGQYIRNLLKELVRLDTSHPYVVLLPTGAAPPYDGKIDAGRVTLIRNDTRNYTLRELMFLPYQLDRIGPSLLHEPHYTVPIVARYKTVVTIHDLIHLHFREYRRSLIKKAYVQLMLRRAVACDRVIVPSENTRRDLIELIGAKPNRITVIPYGLDKSFNPDLPLSDCKAVAQRYGLAGDYILYAGAFKPHKNLPTLLQAWRAVRWDGCLAIAGGGSDREQAALLSLAGELGLLDRIAFLGWVPRQDMPALNRAATALVHPSRYEGFGLPILEAMASGTPVIASNSSSIPEVTGDAALLVEVDSVSELAASIQRLIDSRDLRNEFSERGIRRARVFSWERAAQATLQVYEELA